MSAPSTSQFSSAEPFDRVEVQCRWHHGFRAAITAVYRRCERECVRDLLPAAAPPADGLRSLLHEVSEREGSIVTVQAATSNALAAGDDYDLNCLLEECTVSTNTAAAGGNASLMSISFSVEIAHYMRCLGA
ncbi:hypothetical protein [Methylobacterium indicum]|uniref:Proline utilization A proline dehydrogenase N-terminal domain-containing protein n=1 Tax=Methylobacterium indicum TaxID=1775910 RepID=A0A8H9C926_9HYPH|nr:hypothetical protein [Methylobacterium indicum]BCM86733.1 hypothetical protein mvi_51940 [Methylobacterium indicum]